MDKEKIRKIIEDVVPEVDLEKTIPEENETVPEKTEENLFDDLDEERDIEENFNDTEIKENLADEVDGEINIDEEIIPRSEDDDVRASLLTIVSDLSYPVDYPGVEELFEYKKKYGEIFIIEFGSFVEKVSHNTNPMVVIFTHAKAKMFDEFKEIYPELNYNNKEFSDFILEKCIIYPKFTKTEIENMPGGGYFYLLTQIRSKSYLNTEVTITKV